MQIADEFDPRRLIRSVRNISGLYEKLDRHSSPHIVESLCCWTDLLGFSNVLTEARWLPTDAQWEQIFDRLTHAHSLCYIDLNFLNDFLFTLNDGIVRCCEPGKITTPDELSIWFRTCILAHNRVNEREKNKGLPGARTVLACGPKLEFGPPLITFEDGVLSFNKQNPGGPSHFPKELAERPIAMNPLPLQLNLAFSKACILERLGSRAGVAGPHLFIDQSVLDLTTRLAEAYNLMPVVHEVRENARLVALAKPDREYFHFGFLLEKNPIPIRDKQLETELWRAVAFFPWDEKPPFSFEIF